MPISYTALAVARDSGVHEIVCQSGPISTALVDTVADLLRSSGLERARTLVHDGSHVHYVRRAAMTGVCVATTDVPGKYCFALISGMLAWYGTIPDYEEALGEWMEETSAEAEMDKIRGIDTAVAEANEAMFARAHAYTRMSPARDPAEPASPSLLRRAWDATAWIWLSALILGLSGCCIFWCIFGAAMAVYECRAHRGCYDLETSIFGAGQ